MCRMEHEGEKVVKGQSCPSVNKGTENKMQEIGMKGKMRNFEEGGQDKTAGYRGQAGPKPSSSVLNLEG